MQSKKIHDITTQVKNILVTGPHYFIEIENGKIVNILDKKLSTNLNAEKLEKFNKQYGEDFDILAKRYKKLHLELIVSNPIYIFDVIHINDEDLSGVFYAERLKKLQTLDINNTNLIITNDQPSPMLTKEYEYMIIIRSMLHLPNYPSDIIQKPAQKRGNFLVAGIGQYEQIRKPQKNNYNSLKEVPEELLKNYEQLISTMNDDEKLNYINKHKNSNNEMNNYVSKSNSLLIVDRNLQVVGIYKDLSEIQINENFAYCENATNMINIPNHITNVKLFQVWLVAQIKYSKSRSTFWNVSHLSILSQIPINEVPKYLENISEYTSLKKNKTETLTNCLSKYERLVDVKMFDEELEKKEACEKAFATLRKYINEKRNFNEKRKMYMQHA